MVDSPDWNTSVLNQYKMQKCPFPSFPSLCLSVCLQCDLAERVVSAESIGRFSEANGFITWMEISVKDNKNVGEAMR